MLFQLRKTGCLRAWEWLLKYKTRMSIEGVSLGKGEQRKDYSNLKKFRNKIDYFNKKIKEVLLVNKNFKILKNATF